MNSISKLEGKDTRKRVNTTECKEMGNSPFGSSPGSKSTLTSDIFNSGASLFSGFKSSKSPSEKDSHWDEHNLKLEKELAECKLLLKEEREKSK